MSLEAGCASSTLCLAFKEPLVERIPCQKNQTSPSPTTHSNEDPTPRNKSDFPLINKESQVPQHKNTHVQSANFCHQPGSFLTVVRIEPCVVAQDCEERAASSLRGACFQASEHRKSHREVWEGTEALGPERRRVVHINLPFQSPEGSGRGGERCVLFNSTPCEGP